MEQTAPAPGGHERQQSLTPLYQKLPPSHYLLAVEPDIEIAADTVDMRFGSPVRPGVFGVRMTEGNVNAGNFFVLQNVSDNVRAGDVCADGKFTDAVAVFVCAGVSTKLVAQILVLRMQRSDAIVFDLNRERIRSQIAKAFAQVITDHAVHDKRAVGIHRRSENFAAWQVAPFVRRNDPAGLKPSQLW